MRFFLMIILLISSVSAEDKFTSGEGKFYTTPDDSLSFIQSQLLADAYRDVITKELNTLGLDSQLFWKSFDEKFDTYFTPIHENLKKQFVDGDGKIKNQENYEKALRSKKLALKAKYGKLSRLISSYSIVKMSRSTHMANGRHMSINAKIDRKLLSEKYYQFISQGDQRQFHTLYFSSEYFLNNVVWTDLGVTSQQDLTSVINEHWMNKLKTLIGGQFEQIILADDDTLNKLKTTQANSSQNLEEDQDSSSDDPMKNALWLNVSVQMAKIGIDPEGKKATFSFSGDYILKDLVSGKIVDFADLPGEKVSFSTDSSHQLSSNVGSLIFRMPISQMNELDSKVANMRTVRRSLELTVLGAKSITDIMSLGEFIQGQGVTFQVDSTLKNLDTDRAIIGIDFIGQKEAFFNFLRGLEGKLFDENKTLELPSKGNPLELKVIYKAAALDKENSQRSGL